MACCTFFRLGVNINFLRNAPISHPHPTGLNLFSLLVHKQSKRAYSSFSAAAVATEQPISDQINLDHVLNLSAPKQKALEESKSYISSIESNLAETHKLYLSLIDQYPTTSVDDALYAWSSNTAILVDLRDTKETAQNSIERSISIPFDRLPYLTNHIITEAASMDVKNIYFIDVSGYRSIRAAMMLEEMPDFKGFEIHAVQDGLIGWINASGPLKHTNPKLQQLTEQLEAAVLVPLDQQSKNQPLYDQLVSDFGYVPVEHKALEFINEHGQIGEKPYQLDSFKPDVRSHLKKFFGKFNLM